MAPRLPTGSPFDKMLLLYFALHSDTIIWKAPLELQETRAVPAELSFH